MSHAGGSHTRENENNSVNTFTESTDDYNTEDSDVETKEESTCNVENAIVTDRSKINTENINTESDLDDNARHNVTNVLNCEGSDCSVITDNINSTSIDENIANKCYKGGGDGRCDEFSSNAGNSNITGESSVPGGKASAAGGSGGGGASGALERAMSSLGHWGVYQRWVVALLCVPSLLAPCYTLNYVFVADTVPFCCVVPECEGETVSYDNALAERLLPATPCQRHPLRDDVNVTGPLLCDPHQYNLQDTIPCERRVYANLDTTFAEFDVGCDTWLRTLVGTIRNSATPLALLFTGYVSDTWGRLPALWVSATLAAILGVVKSLSVSYHMYLAMEFLEAALGYGFTSAAYVLLLEWVSPVMRSRVACATGVAYGVGGALFALVAWRVRPWRWLLRTVHAPALLLLSYKYLLHDSPRWLANANKADEAARVIRIASRWNKVHIDEDLVSSLKEEYGEVNSGEGAHPWRRLVRSRVLLLRLLAVGWCWVAAAFVYYGLTLNSVSLAGNKYVNFALNMCMEIVASVVLLMLLERVSRRAAVGGALLLTGIAIIATLQIDDAVATLVVYLLGKVCVTCAFNALYVWSAEVFPTDCRQGALSACSLLGRLGSTLAPQTPLLSMEVQAVLFGAVSVCGAMAVLAAPESRDTALPQTARDTVLPPQPLSARAELL